MLICSTTRIMNTTRNGVGSVSTACSTPRWISARAAACSGPTGGAMVAELGGPPAAGRRSDRVLRSAGAGLHGGSPH